MLKIMLFHFLVIYIEEMHYSFDFMLKKFITLHHHNKQVHSTSKLPISALYLESLVIYCCCQNKNNALMYYLALHTLTTTHKEIQILFMIPGHTKFVPDSLFGLFKKKCRTCNVETMQDMSQVVQSSTDKALNIPVSNQQLHVVCVHKRSTFLHQFFRPIPNILSYQSHILLNLDHFCFKSIPQAPKKKFQYCGIQRKIFQWGKFQKKFHSKVSVLNDSGTYMSKSENSVPPKKLQILHSMTNSSQAAG